jgi:iduronate 2-sulfatase
MKQTIAQSSISYRFKAPWRFVLGLAVLIGGSPFDAETLAAESTARKNVLFIVVDDLNNALGTYGAYPTAKTPRIDQLAEQGMRFDRAYAQDPVCNPSRSSFLSGLRPETTQVYGNFQTPRHKIGDVLMLPEYFHKHGYFTARVGKVAHGRYEKTVSWDISLNAKRDKHYLPGVDRSEVRDNSWIDGAEKGLSRAQILGHVGRKGGMPLTWRATDQREEETQDGLTTRRIIQLLRENRDKPFFIAAGYHKPHQPWVAPASFFAQHPIAKVQLPNEPDDDRDDIPAAALTGYPEDAAHTDDQKRQAIAAYHATVTLIDHQVGLLLDALRELQLEDSTVVVFVSDHGFHLGEHGGLWRKHTQFEESTRVPLIVRAKGVAPGSVTKGLVELVDLYPTLTDLCDLPEPKGLEGTSFRPLLENPNRPWKNAIFSGARHAKAHGHSIRNARYRYTEWAPHNENGQMEFELYDLKNDPREFQNLAYDSDHRANRDELAAQLNQGWRAVRTRLKIKNE